MQVDLISPTASHWRVRRGQRPRGPRIFRYSMLSSLHVAAAMRPYADVRIVDEDIEPVDFDTEADLIGISFMTFNAPRAYEIADRFRAAGKAVIVGGYHPTLMPDEALQHADAVCLGEAEYNVPRMMDDLRAGQLSGLYRSEQVDLRGIPVPDRSLIRRKAYAIPDAIHATRGCPYRCTFCSIAAFNRGKHRTRPVAEVIDELRGLSRFVLFMDDNIIGDRDYATELFSAMIPLGKRWVSQAGIAIGYDPELMSLAARSGCRGLFIGFESLSQQALGGWNKRINRAHDYHAVIRRLHGEGIAVFAGFVFGSDTDCPDVFPKTLEFVLEANVESLQATRLTPFPGTPLFDAMDRAGRIFDKDWSHYNFGHVVFEPLNMSRVALDSGVSWVLRQFYNRRNIARRTWRTLHYVDAGAVLRGLLPLNLGYRTRLAADGTFARARDMMPSQV